MKFFVLSLSGFLSKHPAQQDSEGGPAAKRVASGTGILPGGQLEVC